MAERKSPAASSKRSAARQAAIDKGTANLAKGREARKKQREAAKDNDRETQTERWRRLLDGSLSVRDLDDEEVQRMRVKGKDGTFNGPMPSMPSHLAQQFHREILNRANAQFRTALGDAVKMLAGVVSDPEASNNDKIKAANLIIDRVMGKAVETVRVEAGTDFDSLLRDAAGLDVNRDLDDAAERASGN